MTKKEKKEYKSTIEDLERKFESYYYVMRHGTNDPFWPDGSNLWLIRNHIIYDKRKIKEICETNNIPVPNIAKRLTPEEVSQDYMAPDSKAGRCGLRNRINNTVDNIKYGQLELPI